MTAHLHSEFVPGCYRCDLSKHEIPPSWTDDEIIDAGHRMGWDDHDIALLLATLQEMNEEVPGRG